MSKRIKVLITGATGNTGSLLVPKLLKSDVDVSIFVRDEAKASQWAQKDFFSLHK